MNRGISLSAVGHATSLFFAITFLLCVGFDLLFPARRMYEHGRRCCQDLAGSPGAASFWASSRAMGTVGIWH